MRKVAFAVLSGLIAAFSSYADDSHHEPAAEASAAPADAALSEGIVRKVDMDAKKITIKHGPLENLDMPAMTMVFHVKDPALLEQVKAGETVRFRAEKIDGALTVVRIEPAR